MLEPRVNIGLGLTIAGFLIFILGADPGLFGLDRNHISVSSKQQLFLSVWHCSAWVDSSASRLAKKRTDQSLAQDIGIRLVATGYLISLISGMADVFGFGTQAWPACLFSAPVRRQAWLLEKSSSPSVSCFTCLFFPLSPEA